MKSIEFIAPVEAMRGNLSGRQDLKYAENNNPAYDAPVGNKNYARNYTTRFIGSKRASDGRKIFSVRTKNAVHLTARAKKAMAVLGGAGAMFATLSRNPSSATYAALQVLYNSAVSHGDIRTWRKWCMDIFMGMLKTYESSQVVTNGTSTITIYNPWTPATTAAQITDYAPSQAVLVKFWSELADDGIYFYVNGMTGIAQYYNNISSYITDYPRLNVLGLTLEEIDATNYVKLGSAFVYDPVDDSYVTGDSTVTSNRKYETTTEAPE